MRRQLHVAHQFDAAQHDWLRGRLPADARLARLPADDPWAVAEGVSVLLVTNGKLSSLARTAPRWASGLQWLHTRPTGLDEAPDWLFDVPHLTVSRGAAATAIAEYVLAAILDFEKGLSGLRVTDPAGWAPRRTGSLSGRTLGLVGFGAIGRAVAHRARPFGMKVRAARRRPGADPAATEIVPLPELCATSDHLVLCAPLTAETRGLFDAKTFAQCRPGQHLINVARGGLIVEDALRDALQQTIARATLDVWTEEPPPPGHWIYSHPRVILTPHSASVSPVTEARLQEILEENLTAWLAGRPEAMTGRVSGTVRY